MPKIVCARTDMNGKLYFQLQFVLSIFQYMSNRFSEMIASNVAILATRNCVGFSKRFLFLVNLFLCINVNADNVSTTKINLNSFSLAEDNIFSKISFAMPKNESIGSDDWRCLTELNTIRKGVKNLEPWALKRIYIFYLNQFLKYK